MGKKMKNFFNNTLPGKLLYTGLLSAFAAVFTNKAVTAVQTGKGICIGHSLNILQADRKNNRLPEL